MAVETPVEDPWARHREHGYLPGQPGYISTLSAKEMFGPLPQKKIKGSLELDPFKIITITCLVMAAILVTIFFFKHYRII